MVHEPGDEGGNTLDSAPRWYLSLCVLRVGPSAVGLLVTTCALTFGLSRDERGGRNMDVS